MPWVPLLIAAYFVIDGDAMVVFLRKWRIVTANVGKYLIVGHQLNKEWIEMSLGHLQTLLLVITFSVIDNAVMTAFLVEYVIVETCLEVSFEGGWFLFLLQDQWILTSWKNASVQPTKRTFAAASASGDVLFIIVRGKNAIWDMASELIIMLQHCVVVVICLIINGNMWVYPMFFVVESICAFI